MSGWIKREPVSNLVILGDDEGNVLKAAGLIARVVQDQMYPNRSNYELVQKSGESIMLAGSASLSRQIGPQDVGKFMRVAFKGWGKSANGKFKDIEVLIFEGDATDDMKKWPRWAEIQKGPKKNGVSAKTADVPPAIAGEQSFADYPEAVDDDLPF